MHPLTCKGENCSARVTGKLEIKVRQLQNYLHRPGHIPAAPHPFVKQAARQAAGHRSQLRRPLSLGQRIGWWRDRIILGGRLVCYMMAIGIPAVIALLFRQINRPTKRPLTHSRSRPADTEAHSSITCQLCPKSQHKL
ncbi:MAG: hypothetical protein AAF329_10290 [Cyanobacteria bacterium P01_A01_bin.17]